MQLNVRLIAKTNNRAKTTHHPPKGFIHDPISLPPLTEQNETGILQANPAAGEPVKAAKPKVFKPSDLPLPWSTGFKPAAWRSHLAVKFALFARYKAYRYLC